MQKVKWEVATTSFPNAEKVSLVHHVDGFKKPRTMRLIDGQWKATLRVEPGRIHFRFLVDGQEQWFTSPDWPSDREGNHYCLSNPALYGRLFGIAKQPEASVKMVEAQISGIPEFDVNLVDSAGKALIHHAVDTGNLHLVKFLVDNERCNPNLSTRSNEYPLLIAIKADHKDVIQFLLKRATVTLECETLLSEKGFIFKPSQRTGGSIQEARKIIAFDVSKIKEESISFGKSMRELGFCPIRFDDPNDLAAISRLRDASDEFFNKTQEERKQVAGGRVKVKFINDCSAPTGKWFLSYMDDKEQTKEEDPLHVALSDIYHMMANSAHVSLESLAKYATDDPSAFEYLITPNHLASNLQSFYYLPGEAEISCGTHYDMNILTMVLFDFKTWGLQALCPESYLFNWWPVEELASSNFTGAHAVVFPAASLHRASGGFYSALLHRVMASNTTTRNSTVFKLKPPPTVKFNTADFLRVAEKAHPELDEDSWLAPPIQSMWKNTGISEEKRSGHPFLGMTYQSAKASKNETYEDFSSMLGEWFNMNSRFPDPQSLLESVEIRQAIEVANGIQPTTNTQAVGVGDVVLSIPVFEDDDYGEKM